MKELFLMWNHTKMTILVSITAGLYAALLIPFKILPLFPTITEVRPATCIPIICSLFFGPAAAWGAAVGNLIGDFAGQFGPGSPFGMIGNFIYGFLPYRLWRKFSRRPLKAASSMKHVLLLAFIIIVSSGACATSITWGLTLVGFPFVPIVDMIFLNNAIIGIILVPVLCNWLDKRIYAWHLNYEELLNDSEISSQKFSSFFVGVLILLIIASFIIGHVPYFNKITGNFENYAWLASNPVVAIIFLVLIVVFSLLI